MKAMKQQRSISALSLFFQKSNKTIPMKNNSFLSCNKKNLSSVTNSKQEIEVNKKDNSIEKSAITTEDPYNRKSLFFNDPMDRFYNSNLSIIYGDTFVNLKNNTLGQEIELAAKKFPHSLCLYSAHQNTKYTFEEFNHLVDFTSRCFVGVGIEVNEKIGIYAPNCNEWLLSKFACAKIGGVFVNINPAYQVKELEFTLNKTKISTLIMPKKIKSSNYVEILNEIDSGFKDRFQNRKKLSLKKLPYLKRVILISDEAADEDTSLDHERIAEENNLLTWDDVMTDYNRRRFDDEVIKRKNNVKPQDAVNIQFTSGTTGLPKGATLSHFNIINNGYLIGKNINYDCNDRAIIQVPLYHCFGSVIGNLACITNGAAMIYPSASFNVEKTLKVIEEIKATSLLGVPTMFSEVLNKQHKLRRNVSSLKKGVMAGSICPEYLMNRVINELGITNLSICYGMTELSPVTHQTVYTDSFLQRTTTVGRNLPHSITKITDESGNILPRNSVGEVCSLSFGRMLEYYEEKEATSASFDSEGFMKSGDLGVIDDQGYLSIVGRKKDTIIRGGENISPREIEDYIGTHKKVDIVQVIGVSDPRFGDEVCAWIKLKEGESMSKEDVAKFCYHKLAHYKIPKYVRFVEDFPMTVTNKPQKFKMRDISNDIIEKGTENLKVDMSIVKLH